LKGKVEGEVDLKLIEKADHDGLTTMRQHTSVKRYGEETSRDLGLISPPKKIALLGQGDSVSAMGVEIEGLRCGT